MRTLSKISLLNGSFFPWRANGNTLPVLLNPGILSLSPALSTNVDTESKTKDYRPFIFFRRQRSKVIAQVPRNSPAALPCSLRTYLALRGCDLVTGKSGVPWISLSLQNPLSVVANFEVTAQPFCSAPSGLRTIRLCCKPALDLPVVASVTACPGTKKYPEFFHNLKYKCYGK
jgi:hypothetical protein